MSTIKRILTYGLNVRNLLSNKTGRTYDEIKKLRQRTVYKNYLADEIKKYDAADVSLVSSIPEEATETQSRTLEHQMVRTLSSCPSLTEPPYLVLEQRLYETKPCQAAEQVLLGVEAASNSTPTMEEFVDHYKKVFAKKDLGWKATKFSRTPEADLSQAIGKAEIITNLSEMRESAAGHDGIKREHLRSMPINDLGLSTHERSKHPEVRKQKRMLQMKSKKTGGRKAYEWTQDEVNLLIELERRFQDKRQINKEIQKFLSSKSCKQISDKRRQLRAKSTAQVECSSFESEEEIYFSANEDEPQEMININYIKTIELPEGSKFERANIELDAILTELNANEVINEHNDGIEIGGKNLSVLAFADDIVLLAKSKEAARRQINTLSKILKQLNMELSVPKCATFQIVHSRRSWYIEDPSIMVNNEKIPYIEPDNTFNYLGTKFSSWGGLEKNVSGPLLLNALRNTLKLKLKPAQKLDLFQIYIQPKFIYSLIMNPPSATLLAVLDREIRQEIKNMLHSPTSTSIGFCYTPRKDGGLGLLRLKNVILLSQLKSGVKMSQSEDEITRLALERTSLTKFYKNVAEKYQLNWPPTINEIDEVMIKLKRKDQKDWQEKRLQGQAYKEKEEKYKNIAEDLKVKFNCQTAKVVPIVVGSRGAIPSLIALRSSIEIVNAFIDYD
ncbi:uncharacterized protein LOC143430371 [Xylocopa sonorina]|uniref:uncharacterized protein LOC143430371 n=1 Tax=Xylocopa sonorina TaxID=1818115 RepID=UPI00403A98D2